MHLRFGGNTCLLWKPHKIVPVCPNTPLSVGKEVVKALLESISFDQVKNPSHYSIYHSQYCWNGDHIAFASVMQTEKTCTELCLEKMAGMTARQCHNSPVPADKGWSNVWQHCHEVSSRHLPSDVYSRLQQIYLSRQYSTCTYCCSLFVAAHSGVKSLCITRPVLENTYRITFTLDWSRWHFIFCGDVDEFHLVSWHYSCLISGFCHDVDETYNLLGYYAALSSSSVPTFWDDLSVPKRLYGTAVQHRVISQRSTDLIWHYIRRSYRKHRILLPMLLLCIPMGSSSTDAVRSWQISCLPPAVFLWVDREPQTVVHFSVPSHTYWRLQDSFHVISALLWQYHWHAKYHLCIQYRTSLTTSPVHVAIEWPCCTFSLSDTHPIWNW
jgi:hypothetical protein